MDNVRTMWHNQYTIDLCCKLKKLQLWRCGNLQTLFPPSFLKGLRRLHFLKIDDCSSLKEIFEIDITIVAPRKELSSYNQNMNYVGNKDHPRGYISCFSKSKFVEG